jgi:hypothetical protein
MSKWIIFYNGIIIIYYKRGKYKADTIQIIFIAISYFDILIFLFFDYFVIWEEWSNPKMDLFNNFSLF